MAVRPLAAAVRHTACPGIPTECPGHAVLPTSAVPDHVGPDFEFNILTFVRWTPGFFLRRKHCFPHLLGTREHPECETAPRARHDCLWSEAVNFSRRPDVGERPTRRRYGAGATLPEWTSGPASRPVDVGEARQPEAPTDPGSRRSTLVRLGSLPDRENRATATGPRRGSLLPPPDRAIRGAAFRTQNRRGRS